MKTRSVGALPRRSQQPAGKALTALMLSAALLALAGGIAGCGQKRPLQLPPAKAGTGTATTTTHVAPKADPASSPASAALMPQR